ncbi:MAG: helix-turn-helix transcriptional regulator [bacterium]|nr:helix-turn-helix transcriptional regulator [bacterium]
MSSSVHTSRYRRFLERLRKARREAKLTQVEVAEELEQPQSFVSKCESGERRVDAVELKAFAVLYGRPVTYFLPEDQEDE